MAVLSWRDRSLVAIVALLAAAGHSIATPFVVNQNQYFVHAVGDSDPRLADDWLTNTTDPYPFFSTVMRFAYELAGSTGLRGLAYLATVTGLVAVFMLARQVSPRASLGVPLTAMLLVGLTLSVGRLGSFIPSDWSVSAFQGFAGQYLLMKPGYVQPSTAGVLVLLSLPLWLQYFRSGGDKAIWRPLSAIGLAVVASALAPTYVVVMAVALGAALVTDLLTGQRLSRLPWYAAALVASGVAMLVTNPAMLGLGASSLDSDTALSRFAFELFPNHTLFTRWPVDDSTLLLVIASAVILAPGLRCYAWLSRWLLVATGAALASAVLVYATRWPTLALLFPWRVSVIVVPVAATLIAVRAAQLLQRLPRDHWRWKVVMVAGVIAIPGVASTLAKQSPAEAEAPVAAAVAAQPQGTGLIPLGTGTLRLNAGLPVYVDSMSPPYASADLVEFWRRVDQVNAFWADPESFCTADWADEIDWIELPSTTAGPTCASEWPVLADTGEWRVIQRP